jgi:FKBP-type peptidyl-prolyl cis-trans isomerase SlyD
MTEALHVQDGQVVSLVYTLQVDGQVIDSSEESEPLQFIQGEGHIIPGLESALYDMEVGERKNLVIAPEYGYGELSNEAFIDVPKDQFPAEIPIELGIELQVRSPEGDIMEARIDKIEEDSVRLDFNHPLAGKVLHFDVKVIALRQASADEKSHGHVHDHQHQHED